MVFARAPHLTPVCVTYVTYDTEWPAMHWPRATGWPRTTDWPRTTQAGRVEKQEHAHMQEAGHARTRVLSLKASARGSLT